MNHLTPSVASFYLFPMYQRSMDRGFDRESTFAATKKIRRSLPAPRPSFPSRLIASGPDNDSCIDSSFLVSQPPNDLSSTLWTCPICLGIPRDPAQLVTCGHLGCFSCLNKHLRIRGRVLNGLVQKFVADCPVCRREFDRDDMKIYCFWYPIVRAVFNLVIVRCPLNGSAMPPRQCNWTGTIRALVEHEKFDCPLRKICCPNPRCMFVGVELDVREHFLSCPNLLVICTQCNLPTRWGGYETHICEASLKNALRSK